MPRGIARRRASALVGLGAWTLVTGLAPQPVRAEKKSVPETRVNSAAAGAAASSSPAGVVDAGTRPDVAPSTAAAAKPAVATSPATSTPAAASPAVVPKPATTSTPAAASSAAATKPATTNTPAAASSAAATKPATTSTPAAASSAAVTKPATTSTPAAASPATTSPAVVTSPAATSATAAAPLPAGISPSAPQAVPPTPPPLPVPQFTEESSPATSSPHGGAGKGKHAKVVRNKVIKPLLTDLLLEAQNNSQQIARRYAQLLAAGHYDEARLMHEEEGGRRPDWPTIRAAAQAHSEAHGAPKDVEQHLVTYTGSELLTFFFTARYKDGSELPIRVAIDHSGHVAGAGIGSDSVAALKKRYDRYDHYKTRTMLTLPFYGTWTVSNASPNSGNGHYLNANQRFAVDFYITEEVEPGKRKSHRGGGTKNPDYFAFGQDVLAPADGTVIMVVDGVPDNQPGQVDVYYRLGNSVVLSLGNNEYAHLCHLQNGGMQVRVGDKVTRGQVIARCGNSGNSTAPHLHFQLTDAPLISHAASLPAYFTVGAKDGAKQSVLFASGDHPTQAPPKAAEAAATTTPTPAP